MASPSQTATVQLSNVKGTLKATVLTYGAIVSHLFARDSQGQLRDVVLGFDSPEEYKKTGNPPFFGCAVGRAANRIAKGTFTLNNKQVTLDCNTNDGQAHLHGGKNGFSKREWKILGTPSESSVTLQLVSTDGDQGYPGTLTTVLTYTVTESDELVMEYKAELDPLAQESTIVNLTNHSYFNLSGLQDEQDRLITDHLMVFNDHVTGFLELDKSLVATGTIIPLSSERAQAFDFSEKPGGKVHSIGDRHELAGGYDLAYVMRGDQFHQDCIKVWCNKSGILMTLSTSEPSVQLYSGECIPDTFKSKKSQADASIGLGPHTGFCLEAQRFPNAINVPEWRDQVILAPGQLYGQKTVYRFGNVSTTV